MDSFLDYLIQKSDIKKEFAIRETTYDKTISTQRERITEYRKITIPDVRDYVVFDLETTGMSASVNNIIEIGAVKVVDDQIVDKFSCLVNPKQYITNRISNVTNITNAMVDKCPVIEEVFPKFLEFIKDFPLIAHNAGFDMSFLMINAHRMGFKITNPVLDTLALSRIYNKDCAKHSLNYLTKHFNINLKNAHRAYYDALATCSIYKVIQNRYKNTLAVFD